MFEQLGLIGCGLMGGSFALALKRRAGQARGGLQQITHPPPSGPADGRDRRGGPSALLAVSGADIVLIAVPVAATEATFKAIKHLVTPKCWSWMWAPPSAM
jgi:prephenate dehydrogenase